MPKKIILSAIFPLAVLLLAGCQGKVSSTNQSSSSSNANISTQVVNTNNQTANVNQVTKEYPDTCTAPDVGPTTVKNSSGQEVAVSAVKISDSDQAFEQIKIQARAWASDAIVMDLIGTFSFFNLSPDNMAHFGSTQGKHYGWQSGVYSPSKGETVVYSWINGEAGGSLPQAIDANNKSFYQGTKGIESMAGLITSCQAYAVAKAHGLDDVKNYYHTVFNDKSKYPSKPVWVFNEYSRTKVEKSPLGDFVIRHFIAAQTGEYLGSSGNQYN